MRRTALGCIEMHWNASKYIEMDPNASKRIHMHPNPSKRIRTGPNLSSSVNTKFTWHLMEAFCVNYRILLASINVVLTCIKDWKATYFANFEFFSKLLTAVYPSNMAPLRLKLCQHAFEKFADISFSNVEKVARWIYSFTKLVVADFRQVLA